VFFPKTDQNRRTLYPGEGNYSTGQNLFLALPPLFEEISAKNPCPPSQTYLNEGSHDPGDLDLEMPICAILAYISYLKLY